MFSLSIIICTHNPRFDYLSQTLEALRKQTFSPKKWELLLVDNASDQPLAENIDLHWHPHAKHICEVQLGLTRARLRGIREAKADILVFVDDDNVLDPDYLENVERIGQDWPMLGAWGGGQIRPKFEQEPPPWTKTYWSFLAIRETERDIWSNIGKLDQTIPCGAGLCVRRTVAERYAQSVVNKSMRLLLDRCGNLLTSGGDLDLALTSCDIGLGMGQFTALCLTHLIPHHRVTEDYLLKLAEGILYSSVILGHIRGKTPPKPNWKLKPFQFLARLKMNARQRRFDRAIWKGKYSAYKDIEHFIAKNGSPH